MLPTESTVVAASGAMRSHRRSHRDFAPHRDLRACLEGSFSSLPGSTPKASAKLPAMANASMVDGSAPFVFVHYAVRRDGNPKLDGVAFLNH